MQTCGFQKLAAEMRVTCSVAGGKREDGRRRLLFLAQNAEQACYSKFVQLGAWPLGDLDGDGTVGIIDLLLLLAGWGSCAGCSADLDADGAVGILDLLTLLANWR